LFYNVILDLLWTKWSWNTSFTDHSIPCTLRCTMILWHMGPRQSLSEVVGTHVVLACKWIITVFLHTIPLPSPSPHPNQCCLNQNISNPTRNGTQHWTGGGGDCRLLKFKGFVASVPRLLKLIVGLHNDRISF
jgi:hypothetical protein